MSHEVTPRIETPLNTAFSPNRRDSETGSNVEVRQTSLGLLPLTGQTMRRRRFPWKTTTLILTVALPTVLTGIYLHQYAADQYVSEFRYRLRHAQPAKLENTSALAGLAGAGAALETMTDSEIVVQYLQSRQVIDDIQQDVDLDTIYGRNQRDWWNSLPHGEPIEDKVKYWRHVADPFFDASTGVTTVKVRAFERADAQRVSQALLTSAEKLVNELSRRAEGNRLTYTLQSVDLKLAAWKEAETALRNFRNANEVVLPNIQASESSRLDGSLRSAESRIRASLDALRLQGISDTSPQARTLKAQFDSVTAEIKRTQTQQTRSEPPVAPSLKGEKGQVSLQSFATILTTYESLETVAKISAKTYELALTAEQRARDEASQQQIYLDAFVKPAVAEKSIYPVRWRILLEVSLGSFACWCLGVLLWRGIMDHID